MAYPPHIIRRIREMGAMETPYIAIARALHIRRSIVGETLGPYRRGPRSLEGLRAVEQAAIRHAVSRERDAKGKFL